MPIPIQWGATDHIKRSRIIATLTKQIHYNVIDTKEGRALGEVTKFLVYNARKRQEGGDRTDAYFAPTKCVAAVEDMRFQR